MPRIGAVALVCAFIAGAEPTLSISVTPGPEYTHPLGGRKIPPQLAIWIEDTAGVFIQTVFVTRFSRNDFGEKKVKRPDALPVWRHRGMQPAVESDAMSMATFKADAESGATPEASFEKKWTVPPDLPGKTVAIMAEINCAFDYNDVYRKNLPRTDQRFNGVNGRPSIVWRTIIRLSETENPLLLSPIGHGDVRGENGRVKNGFHGIPDTFSIVKRIQCVYTNR